MSEQLNNSNAVTEDTLKTEPVKPPEKFVPYKVSIAVPSLNVRETPGIGNTVVKTFIGNKQVHTIVEESKGKGAKKWGRLQSGLGWIALDHTKPV